MRQDRMKNNCAVTKDEKFIFRCFCQMLIHFILFHPVHPV